MKKTFLAIAVIAASATAALSADDPIAQRKALMQASGGAAGLSAGMMKGEIPYNPAAGKAAITAFYGISATFGDFFPEGSDMGADTKASPKIWEDPAGFEAALAKFEADASAAMQASGRDGPADLDAFKAAIGPVLGNCKSCHESFQIQQ